MNKAFYIIFLFLIPLFLSAQKKTTKIEILNADALEYDETLGKGAKRLIGNVQLKHDDANMFCDSAYFYSNNSIDAFGNIRVLQGDSLQLYGDSLNYNGNTKIAKLRGNIRLNSPDMSLTSNFLDYDRKKNFAYYFGGGSMVNKKENNTLTSNQGYYYPSSRSFFFKNNVKLTNPEYVMTSDTLQFNEVTEIVFFHGPTTIKAQDNFIYCENGWYNTRKDESKYFKNAYIITGTQRIEGDTLFYNRKKGLGELTCNVLINDTAEKLQIFSDKAFIFEKSDSALITQNALLLQIFTDDTLFLHADTFIIQTIKDTTQTFVPDSANIIENTFEENTDSTDTKNDDKRILYAFRSVKFYKQDMQGKCDSLVYSFLDSAISMYREPIIWNEENQLTADFIKIRTYDTIVHSLYMINNAFIISEVDSIRYNQIKGKDMTGTFKNNKLNRILVEGNGQSIYYGKDEDNKFIGVNVAESTNILITIGEDKIENITYIGAPQATLHPLYELSQEELILDGFKWHSNIRPRNMFDLFLK
jgi:lipopolysaccharide export system protein LptA